MTGIKGHIRKMNPTLASPVEYELPLDSTSVKMNDFIGKPLQLHFTGEINCLNCDRKIPKTFNQGYCFPCMRSLASCDMCIVKPELCHFFEGTCREPKWGEAHCMKQHYIYLANSSGLKVGITREVNIPTRWLDQGATQALPIMKVQSRLQSGVVEIILKKHFNDKTNWRRMLQGPADPIDMLAKRDELVPPLHDEINTALKPLNGQIEFLDDEPIVEIHYPVEQYPEKIKSLNFDKEPNIEGLLQGIKGQYLMFDIGVINMRKFAGYEIELISN